MSARETSKPSIALLRIEGVDERGHIVETKSRDFDNIEGTFPEFAGLQGRVFGKRLHAIFDNAVMAMAQFWSPMGYGGGLYQIRGRLMFGAWFAPIARLLAIPPASLPIDMRGLTVNEFGEPCRTALLTTPSINPNPYGVVDDNNGGSHGTGSYTKVVTHSVLIPIQPYLVEQKVGEDSVNFVPYNGFAKNDLSAIYCTGILVDYTRLELGATELNPTLVNYVDLSPGDQATYFGVIKYVNNRESSRTYTAISGYCDWEAVFNQSGEKVISTALLVLPPLSYVGNLITQIDLEINDLGVYSYHRVAPESTTDLFLILQAAVGGTVPNGSYGYTLSYSREIRNLRLKYQTLETLLNV